jgi:hypothetical protein
VAAPQIPVSVCERLIEAGTKPCPAPVAAPPLQAAPQPEWDALANSLASVGAAVAWGGTVLAIIALIAGIAWAKLLRGIAREESRRCAEELMEKWLAEEAPQLLSRMNASIQDASIGDTEDTLAADQMGEGA